MTPEMAAFLAFLRTGNPAATMRTDIPTDGGYLAPPEFRNDVVRGLDTGFWFRTLCTVHEPTRAPQVQYGRRTATATPFVWAEELAVPAVDSGLKFGRLNLTPHYMTGEFQVSNSALTGANAEAVVKREIVATAGPVEEQAFVAGDGQGKPLGIFAPSVLGVGPDRDFPVPATPAFDPTAFFRCAMTLAAPYLRSPSVRWLMHRSALAFAATVKDSTGRPVLALDRDAYYLAGIKVELSESAPTGSGAGGAYQAGDYLAAVGDLKFYSVQDGPDLSVDRPQDSALARMGLQTFIVRRKVDGCPRVAEAFARLKLTA